MQAGIQHSRLGDYELLAKLGEGGMGAVYKARQISLDRIVALKVLPRRLAADKVYLDRFRREAHAVARLNHPNIVAGYDVGYADGYNYFCMEFVEGVTLRAKIKELTTLSEMEALRIGAPIAAALAHAHRSGIIHRDVKPDNILLGPNGVPKLTDLGLSKVAEKQDSYLTQSGLVVGTAYYIAPEQARGDGPVDGRADVYALGCTLYHALTGKPPFDAPTPMTLMLKHLGEKMPHPQSLRPDLSDEICQILAWMLARDPAHRFPSADATAREMELLATARPLSVEPLAADFVNFLPGPKPPDRDIKQAPRASLKKSAPAAPTVRIQRMIRRQGGTSWTLPALLIAMVLLGVTGLIVVYSEAKADKSAGTPEHGLQSSTPIKTETDSAPVKTDAAAQVASRPAAPQPAIKLPEIAPTHGPKDAQPAAPTLPSPPPQAIKTHEAKFAPIADPSMPMLSDGISKSPGIAPRPPEPKAGDAPLVSLLTDFQSDNAWRKRADKWEFANGKLTGTGQGNNASISKDNCLPRDFELFVTAQAQGAFHFGWSSREGGNFVHYLNQGNIDILGHANGHSIVLAHSKIPIALGQNTYRVVVKGTNIAVYVNGALVVESDAGAPPEGRDHRDLHLYAGSASIVEYQKIEFRDLTGK